MKGVGESGRAQQQSVLKREATAAKSGGTLGDLLKEKFGEQLANLASNPPAEGETAESETAESESNQES
jgi:hypothetical protein